MSDLEFTGLPQRAQRPGDEIVVRDSAAADSDAEKYARIPPPGNPVSAVAVQPKADDPGTHEIIITLLSGGTVKADLPDAVTTDPIAAGSYDNGTLTFTRASGTNPIVIEGLPTDVVTAQTFSQELAVRDGLINIVAAAADSNSKAIAAIGAANIPPPLSQLAARTRYTEGDAASWRQLPYQQAAFPRKTDLLVAALFGAADPRTADANVTLANLYGAQAAGAPNAADIAAIPNSALRYFADPHSPSNPLQGLNAMAYRRALIIPATAGRLNAPQEADNGKLFGGFSSALLDDLPTAGGELIPLLWTSATNNPARGKILIGYRNRKLIVEQAGGNTIQRERTDIYVAGDFANALHNQHYDAILPPAFTGGQVTLEFIKESTNNAAIREVVTRQFNVANPANNVAAANVVYNFAGEAIETARVSYTASTRTLRIDTANSFPAVINQQYHLRIKYPVTVQWQQPGSWSDYELLAADDHDENGIFDPSADPSRQRNQRIDVAFCLQDKFIGNEADPYMTLRVRVNGRSTNRIIDLNRKRSDLFANGFNLRVGGSRFAAAQLAAQRWDELPPTDKELSQIAAAHTRGQAGLGVYHKASGKDTFALDAVLTAKTAAGETASPVAFGVNQIADNNPINSIDALANSRPLVVPPGAKWIIVRGSTYSLLAGGDVIAVESVKTEVNGHRIDNDGLSARFHFTKDAQGNITAIVADSLTIGSAIEYVAVLAT